VHLVVLGWWFLLLQAYTAAVAESIDRLGAHRLTSIWFSRTVWLSGPDISAAAGFPIFVRLFPAIKCAQRESPTFDDFSAEFHNALAGKTQ